MSSLALLAVSLLVKPALPSQQRPYLQLGQAVEGSTLEIVWQTPGGSPEGNIEWRQIGGTWKPAGQVSGYRIRVKGSPEIDIHRAIVNPEPGQDFDYRLVRHGVTLSRATGHARPTERGKQTFAVLGDCSEGSAAQAEIAEKLSSLDPEYLVITGDIVYQHGRLSEYASRFFPYYAADKPDPKVGAPLLGRTLFVGAPGNHDLAESFDTNAFPDLWGYFAFWSQPMNGPAYRFGQVGTPLLNGPRLAELRAMAGNRAPRMANFSFDMGDVHWLVLDSNPYAHVRGPTLTNWIDQDLRSSQKRWTFVAFHHPPFQSAPKHADDIWMRNLHDLFVRDGVDVVWCGHVHNYQVNRPIGLKGTAREWPIDTAWDGRTVTKP
ncbi:MAG: metallophosphoesterase, partial [bacterium]